MEYGIVYLLTNPVMPGLVKIGMTTQEDIDKRTKRFIVYSAAVMDFEKINGADSE